jgi:putative ABC transport system permease protein
MIKIQQGKGNSRYLPSSSRRGGKMLSVLKVSIANIKKKKGQNVLIALIIFSMALAFSTSIVVLSEINKPFEKMFNSQKGSHLSLVFSNRVHNVDEVAAWWRSQDEIESVQVLNQYWLPDKVYFKGDKLTTNFMMTEMHAGTQTQDIPRIIEGEKKEKPGIGEMWLPIAVADSNKIRVGDTIDIPVGNGTETLKVSALVVDPLYCSSLFNPTRVWIAPGSLASMFPLTDLNNASLGIRFKDYSKSAELLKKFDSFLKQPFSGTKIDYETAYSGNLFSYQVIGAILLILSIIIIFIALFIIYFTITNAVLSEYKTIGILKSQGFSKANIISVFSMQYLMISLVFIPLGIVLSKFTSQLLLKSLIRAIGMGSGNISLLLPGMITFTALNLLVLIVAWITSVKAGRVKPAEAIRYGAPEKDYSRGFSIPSAALKRLSLPMILGIKDMLSNKRQSLFLMAVTAVTGMVIAFSLNLNYSMNRMTENSAYWGFENNDITISKQGARFSMTHEDIMEKLNNETNIDTIVSSSYLTNCSIIDDKTNTSKSIIGTVYDGDLNSIGMLNIEGRHPQNENEVSLAINTSRELDKKPGDMVDLYIDGVKMNLLVTGVYQSIGNVGRGFRIQEVAVKNANPTFEPDSYGIVLKDKAIWKAISQNSKINWGHRLL